MTTDKIIAELEAHLATHFTQRDPRKSDQLMGCAMVQLKEARRLIRETVTPSSCYNPAAVNIAHDKALRDFIS